MAFEDIVVKMHVIQIETVLKFYTVFMLRWLAKDLSYPFIESHPSQIWHLKILL